MSVRQALTQLSFSKKKSAHPIKVLLHRAFANINHNTNYQINHKHSKQPPPPPSIDHLEIINVIVGKGVYRRDIRMHARGRHGIVHHPSCHVKITLKEIIDQDRVDSFKGLFSGRRESKFELLYKSIRKHKLYQTINDHKPLVVNNPPWTHKGWKYVSVKRWRNPDTVLAKWKRQYNHAE